MIKRTLSLPFWFGDDVTLKVDPEFARIITGIILRPTGNMYELSSVGDPEWRHEIEIEGFQRGAPPKGKVAGFMGEGKAKKNNAK
jgi:hypothetical protein